MAKRRVVLLLGGESPPLKATLEAKFELYLLADQKDPDAFLAEKGASISGLVRVSIPAIAVDEALVSKLPNLEIVSCFSVGVDGVDVPFLRSKGVEVTNTPDVLTDCVAETTFALLLAVVRNIVPADRYVRAGRWQKDGNLPLTTQLCQKHVGVIGLGRIGAEIAKRAECFGCPVAYWGRTAKSQYPAYKFYGSVVDLARDCDVLIAACSLNKGTIKLIDRKVLDALGPEGYVVNIARGEVIDEAELVKALAERRIAGAGLDVFEKEPHVPAELFALDNVVLLPHVGSASIETRQGMADLVVANLEAHFSGEPTLNPVH